MLRSINTSSGAAGIGTQTKPRWAKIAYFEAKIAYFEAKIAYFEAFARRGQAQIRLACF